MKKKTITKASELLRAARQRLTSGTSNYICYAVFGITEASARLRSRVRNRIMRDLHPYVTYSEWLRNTKPGFARKKGLDWWSEESEYKRGRLAWIDHLIKVYEAKGD